MATGDPQLRSVGSGLVAKDGELKGFTIAGADKKFVWAKAAIVGDNVIVQSAECPDNCRPVWLGQLSVVNLWTRKVCPHHHRTDDFPMITAAKEVGVLRQCFGKRRLIHAHPRLKSLQGAIKGLLCSGWNIELNTKG